MSFLKNVEYILTTHDIKIMPKDDKKEIVIVGRSNVGKSTFINTITNNRSLARISSKPGKTRAISFYDVNNKFRLVDIPGYGYANVSKSQLKLFASMLESYFFNRTNLSHAILLLDMRRKISKEDEEIISYFLEIDLSFSIIGTKKDKCNQSEIHKFNSLIASQLGTTPLNYSSIKKSGLNKVMNIFEKYL